MVLLCFEAESHYGDGAGLELAAILLPLPPVLELLKMFSFLGRGGAHIGETEVGGSPRF